MKRLYFMRHGLSEMNVQGLVSGVTESPLTAEGRAAAKKAGQDTQHLKIDLIVASPMSRALETAQIFAKEIGYSVENIKISPLLIERNFGELEGAPFGPVGDRSQILEYEQDDALLARAQQALDWINSLDAESILIVSHGAIGRAIRSLVREDFPMSHPHRMDNTELVCWIEED
jgi:probable phosphoglycerate mutase